MVNSTKKPPAWRSPWRFTSFWVTLLVAATLIFSGGFQSLEEAWRSTAIGYGRALNPIPPDPNNPNFPLCIVFASSGENYRDDLIDGPGRFSMEPDEATRRLTLLLGVLAALPEESRPKAIGIDLVLPLKHPVIDPYLIAALQRLNNVVLACSEEPGDNGQLELLLPNENLLEAVSAIGLDTFRIPLWVGPGSGSRLFATGRSSYQTTTGETVTSLGVKLAQMADAEKTAPWLNIEQIPLHYWNLYYPHQVGDDNNDGLMGLWPARKALDFQFKGAEWKPGESPEQWMARLETTLAITPLGMILGADVANRLLLIGLGHPHDLTPTPFTQAIYRSPNRQGYRLPRSPGILLHAQTATSLLEGTVPTLFYRQYIPLYILMLIIGMALCWYGGIRYSSPVVIIGAIISGVTLLTVDWLLTAYQNLWLSSPTLIIIPSLILFSAIFERYRLLVHSRNHVNKWVTRLMPATAVGTIDQNDDSAFASANEALLSQPQSAWRTVLRTDLAGYTPLTRGLEIAGRTDLVLSSISDFFLRAMDVVDKHGGQITDLTGDGLVSVYTQETPEEQSRQAHETALALAEIADQWRRDTEEKLRSENLGNIPVPGIRIAVGSSETNFRFVGNEHQQRALFFGGAFVSAARIESGTKQLPLPKGANPLCRVCFDPDAAQALKAEISSSLFRHENVSMKGFEKKIDVFEFFGNKA